MILFRFQIITASCERSLKHPLRVPLKLHLSNISMIKQLSLTVRLSLVCCSIGQMVVNTVRFAVSLFSKINRPILL